MDPQWIIAISAAATLLMMWTSSIAGATIWLMKKLDGMERRILDDIQQKHEENRIKVDALQTLVIRHDTILDPEFNGSGDRQRRRQQ